MLMENWMNRFKDPLISLINYVLDNKPYHTKIYEVLLEYTYTEAVTASVVEHYHIDIIATTPEADKWFICDGVGWDVLPYDIGMWDYPAECNTANPSKIVAIVSDNIIMDITIDATNDLIFTYAQDHPHNIGWDRTRYDHVQWDSWTTDKWMQVDDESNEGASTQIVETIEFIIT